MLKHVESTTLNLFVQVFSSRYRIHSVGDFATHCLMLLPSEPGSIKARLMPKILKDFPVIVDIPIAWGDMDAFQHVNNTVYFRYFETARIACFERMNLYKVRDTSGIGPILHSINCRFRIPLTYPDTVSVGTKVTEVLDDRFTIESCAVSHQHQKVAAQGTAIVVSFDYQAQTKAQWPSEVRQNILGLGIRD